MGQVCNSNVGRPPPARTGISGPLAPVGLPWGWPHSLAMGNSHTNRFVWISLLWEIPTRTGSFCGEIASSVKLEGDCEWATVNSNSGSEANNNLYPIDTNS